MAYELNLTDEQYEAAYEINLDYLMGVTSYDDVYGDYWERRNRDLSYVLLDAQWQAYIAASYFYRPLYWSAGYWHFGIYARYPHRDYFYFGRPAFYATYRGAHAWHLHGTHGYYYNHRHHFRPAAGRVHFGMHDRWNRGDFHRHHGGTVGRHGGTSRPHGGSIGNHGTSDRRLGNFGGSRTSSTRTTVNNTNNQHSGSFSGSRSSSSFGGSRSNGSFGSSRSSGSFSGSRSGGSNSSTTRGSFGGGSRSSGGFGSGHSGGSRGSGSHGGGSRSGGSFGSRR
jgi:hypothetical protein